MMTIGQGSKSAGVMVWLFRREHQGDAPTSGHFFCNVAGMWFWIFLMWNSWLKSWTCLFLPSGNLTWLLKMAIECVDSPIKNSDFPVCNKLPKGRFPNYLRKIPFLLIRFGDLWVPRTAQECHCHSWGRAIAPPARKQDGLCLVSLGKLYRHHCDRTLGMVNSLVGVTIPKWP